MAPTTQQAWIVKKKGVPKDALVFETEHPVKKPGKGEVLVKVQAVALNPAYVVVSLHTRCLLIGRFSCSGHKLMLFPNFLVKRPFVAEYDLAGTIEDPNDSDFKQGEEVFGCIPISTRISPHTGSPN